MKSTTLHPEHHRSKQHFEILDGLRGIAAIAVVVFHFMEFVVPDYKESFIAHAYLAVDFFFCLSGFVIAYAYDAKLTSIGFARFFKLRLIRLHPMVIIGSIIGLIAFVFDPYSNLFDKYGMIKSLQMFITSCLMIPYPLVPERYFNLFHLNAPSWSLFWEYVANILYAFLLIRIRNKFLWLLVIIGAGALFYESFSSGFLGVGWGGDNARAGGIRVFYSFLAGLLVFRSGWILRSSLGFFALAVLLFISFLVPYIDDWNKVMDPLIVIFYFPFLIALGVGAQLTSMWKGLCKFLGDISYPLYMIHYPFLWIFLSYIESRKPSMAVMTAMIPIGTILLIAFAYFIFITIDKPIRRFLLDRVNKRPLLATAK